jgi:hypothetical protein
MNNMRPMVWLEKMSPGFVLVPTEDRGAILDFTLLWTFFEQTVLNKQGDADAIISAVNSIRDHGKLNLEAVQPAIRYFRSRYYDTDLTGAYRKLKMDRQKKVHRDLVQKYICGQSDDPADILSALLIIIYRLRNNLFYGEKWTDDIRGELKNFQNANDVLMTVTEMHTEAERNS